MSIKTTHIGSLPFQSIDEAVEHSFLYTMPSVPTLPSLSKNEQMVEQVKDFKNSQYYEFICMNRFMSKLGADKVFKAQITGPLTMSKFLNLSKNELSKHKDNILRSFDQKDRCYFFLDEPICFKNEDEKEVLYQFIKALKPHFYKIGVHSCAKIKLSDFEQLGIDGLSYDLFLSRPQTKYSFEQFQGVYSKGGFINPVGKPQWLAPSCGLALEPIKKVKMMPMCLASMVQNDPIVS